MPLTEEILPQNEHSITGYEPGKIIFNHSKTFDHSIILTSTAEPELWQPQSLEALTIHHFNDIIKTNPPILLIGTGEQHQQIPHNIINTLHQHQIGVEIMSTLAACRTFTLLNIEGRDCMAALLIR